MVNVKETYNDQKLDQQRLAFLKDTPKYLGDSWLAKITPTKGYKVHEDYLTVTDNGRVLAPILIYNDQGKATDLDGQWGVEFIKNLVDDVTNKKNKDITITFINSIRKMDKEGWVKKHERDAYNYSDKSTDAETYADAASAKHNTDDLQLIAQELDAGASYLDVGLRYVISAKSVDELDDFLDTLQTRLSQNVPGIIVALPNGDADKTMARILGDPMKEPGRKMMFTSNEFAGFYNLVTQGIEDPHGCYVGQQTGDINNPAVIWDMTNFSKTAVMSIDNRFLRERDLNNGGQIPQRFENFTGSDLWLNALILQLVREKQGNVYTLALDPVHISDNLNTVTSAIDLNHGAINPFEMFGSSDPSQEGSIFSANLAKWQIITRQLAEQSITVDDNRIQKEPISTAELSDLAQVLERFYIDSRMWVKDGANHTDKTRIINLNHSQVPRLTKFIAYLQGEYDNYSTGRNKDELKARELNKLLSIYRTLQSANSDLFDTVTDSSFDNMGLTRHTLFDYSHLAERKGNILLVQLINSISAIANTTKTGDVVIIHGAQRITSLAQSYLKQIFSDLFAKHVRIVFSYNSSEAMLNNVKFNKMSSADWVLTGYLTADQVTQYNKLLGNQRQLSEVIQANIKQVIDTRYYLRRYQSNVVFNADPYI